MFLTESTSDNSGHTATLRYAKIDSLRSPTSYVRQTLGDICLRTPNKEVVVLNEEKKNIL